MKRILTKVILLATFVSFTKVNFAQCTVDVSPISVTITCGESVDLSSIGLSGLPSLSTDFNDMTNGVGWQTSATLLYDNPCGPSLDGTPAAWFGNVPLPRTLTTNGFDMSCGGQVCFDFDYAGDEAPNYNDCEDPDLVEEGVYFQYSVDGGANWIDIIYFETTPDISGPYYSWANYCFILPPGAWSTSTMFQWDQPEATSSVNDHWGIDNVVITPSDCGFWYDWDNLPASNDPQNQTVSPTTTTTYQVTYTNGTVSCTNDVTVIVNPLEVDVTATPVNLSCGQCTDLDVILLNPPTNVCMESESVSGPDASTSVSINNFACVPVGATITSVTMDGSIGAQCPTWYDFDLLIDGVYVQSGLCNSTGLDLTSYLPFTSVSMNSNDNDIYSDNITLDLTLYITYTSNPIYTYSWSPSTALIDPNIQNPNACPTDDITYVATLTETNSGCTASDDVDIFYTCNGCFITDFNPIPGPCDPSNNTYGISGNVSFAGNPTTGTLIIEVNNGITIYDTTIVAPFVSPLSWSISGIPSDASASTINVYFSDDMTCDSTVSFVAPIPCVCSAEFEYGVYCANETDPLPTFLNGGVAGVFTASPFGLIFDPISGLVDLDLSVPGTYVLTNTIIVTGCATTNFSNGITINEIPDATIIGNATACPGIGLPDVSVDFIAGSANWNLTYNFNGSPVTVIEIPTSTFNINGGVGTYELIGVIDNNGCSNPLSGSVIQSEYTTPVADPILNIEICEGENLIIPPFSSQPTGAFFEWLSTNDIGFGLFGSGNVGSLAGINGTELDVTATVQFTPTSAEGCQGLPMNFNITIHPLPTVSFMADPVSGCEPLTVNFTNLTNPSGQYCTWNFGDGNIGTGCSEVSNTYMAGVYDVSLNVVTEFACVGEVEYSQLINVDQMPEAYFSYYPQEITVEDPIVDFTNTSLFSDSYQWSFGDASSMTNLENPSHLYPEIPGQYLVTLWAYNGSCYDSIQQLVIVQDIILYFVPNVFTPDQDDFNETFQPIFTSGYDPYDYHLMIFNRWGELIFESYDASQGWNGTYGNGGLVEDGVYVWQIDFKESMSDKRHADAGHVSVLK